MLHPVTNPVTRGQPSSEAWVARCLLGAGWVGGSGKLTMLDLRTWAALGGLLRTQLGDRPLAERERAIVETTGYQLADMVFATDGGSEYRKLRASLIRLRQVTITVETVEHEADLAAETLHEGWVGIVNDVWAATTRLDLRTPREWGALKGSTSLRVELGHWTAEQVLSGRCTWLDLDLLRALGAGLPARLWCALEGWARWPAQSLDGAEETAIGLGRPALESLGVGGYGRAERARAALNRAGARLAATDPAYDMVRCERRGGGWTLVARRLRGSRARTAARATAPWRSPGIALGERRRRADSALRVEVRAAARASLTDATLTAHGVRHPPGQE